MKILTIHADFIEFQAKKRALKQAEEVALAASGSTPKKERVEECLVVFTAVEKRDEDNLGGTTDRYVHEIKEVANQVKTKTIVLYPYAHLSSALSLPAKAEQVLKEAEKKLLEEKYKVTRAPFGWYKSFTLACKGHPLSELSREFVVGKEEKRGIGKGEGKDETGPSKPKQEISEAVKAEEKLISTWYILDVNGKLNPISYDKEKRKFSGYDFKNGIKNTPTLANLQKFAAYELAKSRVANEEPPHVKLMKKLELVDYEPGSDPGNLRFYPKGRFIKGQIERWVTQKVKEYGGMEMESPLMYDHEHPAFKSYLNRFPARQYTIETPNKKVFLRFSACFGQFLELHDAQISYKHLPVWLYELTRYSFRVEQHGELTGLRRLRAFTMPDCHALVADEQQAKAEMLRRFRLAKEVQEGIGFTLPNDLELAIRTTKEFWEKNQEFVKQLVKTWGKPALIEMWDRQFFYFCLKYEWNFVDMQEKASALTTDQIDIENAERYDINYVDEQGKKKRPLILHLSPSGAVERVIYALLERAAMDEKAGKTPQFPLWLAPTQVRLIPVSIERHLEFCKGIQEEFSKLQVRADIDDRLESVGKRIREAEIEWVPYVLVVGDDELKDKFKRLTVRDREKSGKGEKEGEGKTGGKRSGEEKMRFDELIDLLRRRTAGRPYDTLPLPVLLSRRVGFSG